VATSILNDIESGMATLIAAMTRGGGYNFDWGSVNEIDRAKQTFPSAQITLTNETNIDEDGGAWGKAYYNYADYDILVVARLETEAASPVYEINKDLNLALDDLKMLFGSNYSVSGKCDTVMYKGMERKIERVGDIFIPKNMTTHWRVRYTQLRTSPSTTAS
jgi:hypothetical protein